MGYYYQSGILCSCETIFFSKKLVNQTINLSETIATLLQHMHTGRIQYPMTTHNENIIANIMHYMHAKS